MAAKFGVYDSCLQGSDNFTRISWPPVNMAASPVIVYEDQLEQISTKIEIQFFDSAAKYFKNLPTELDPALIVLYKKSVDAFGKNLWVRTLVAVVHGLSGKRANRYTAGIWYESDRTRS